MKYIIISILFVLFCSSCFVKKNRPYLFDKNNNNQILLFEEGKFSIKLFCQMQEWYVLSKERGTQEELKRIERRDKNEFLVAILKFKNPNRLFIKKLYGEIYCIENNAKIKKGKIMLGLSYMPDDKLVKLNITDTLYNYQLQPEDLNYFELYFKTQQKELVNNVKFLIKLSLDISYNGVNKNIVYSDTLFRQVKHDFELLHP